MLRAVQRAEEMKAILENRSIPVVNMALRRDRHSDQRRYNAPTSNEIAMVFVNDDGEPPFQRDIRIYPKNPANATQQFIPINILSPNLDPMTYAILYPYGEPGWQPNLTTECYIRQQRKRTNVSMLQYKVAQTAIRDEFSPIIHAGKLTQQWLVDSYLQVEANNLNYIRNKQSMLRCELYQGLADHVANVAANAGTTAGVPIILPSSFEGSPRNMRERLQDAMSIFRKFGPPDVFLTFTSNPNWPEIKSNLMEGESTVDRPDLVARVFHLKLKELIKDLTVHMVLGRCIAFVYTIEFQKRGLPHAHILLVLHDDDKFKSTERIDAVVSAEIPNESQHPRLFQIVTRNMIHGPCGIHNQSAPCMRDGICSKHFPKQHIEDTELNVNGYPSYRRRIGRTVPIRGQLLDNRYVVPYNKFLLLKYNAHINVEVCTSLRAIKYIYKYIYKGYDCANVCISVTENYVHNEIERFLDSRYVSAPEAMWRLLETKMHDRSHAIIRLPVHLPNQQQITFLPGNEQRALQLAQQRKTKLTAWFDLNNQDPDACSLLYSDIPYNYVFCKNQWSKRQRGSAKIVPRMYTVGVHDLERFYLRLNLLHVAGAKSFEDLRTVNNIQYLTFKEAAFHRNLISSDEEWDRCLEEASHFHMPMQIRHKFAFICVFCVPHNALQLWEKYK